MKTMDSIGTSLYSHCDWLRHEGGDDPCSFADSKYPIRLDLSEALYLLGRRPLYFNHVYGIDFAKAEVKAQIAL